MELTWDSSQRILRKGRAALLFSTRLPLGAGAMEAISACYRQAEKRLEQYALEILLPQMEQTLAEEPRRNRLHATLPSLQLMCDGEIVQDRWISLTLSLRMEEAGAMSARQDHRVWDGQTGRLCPLEFFLSPKEAKRYCRWSYFIRNGRIGVLPSQGKEWTTLALPSVQGN